MPAASPDDILRPSSQSPSLSHTLAFPFSFSFLLTQFVTGTSYSSAHSFLLLHPGPLPPSHLFLLRVGLNGLISLSCSGVPSPFPVILHPMGPAGSGSHPYAFSSYSPSPCSSTSFFLPPHPFLHLSFLLAFPAFILPHPPPSFSSLLLSLSSSAPVPFLLGWSGLSGGTSLINGESDYTSL